MEEEVKQLKAYMDASNNTVAVTGSGICYGYGMTRLKQQTNRMDQMRMMSPKYVKSHPEDFYALMKSSFLDATFEKGPSTVHKQLARLEQEGKLAGIVTQNMDCLHTIAGSKNVAEIMGSFADSRCVDCGATYHDYTLWGQGHEPRCTKCGGPLIPSCFDRGAPDSEKNSTARMEKAKEMIANAQLVIIIGTSGFRSDEYMSRLKSGTKLVQINPGHTVFDQMVNLNIRMDAAKVFDEILQAENS